MRSEHRGPLVASIVVVLACIGVMVHAVRTDALGGIGARLPMGMVAASVLHPKEKLTEAPVAAGAEAPTVAGPGAAPQRAENHAELKTPPNRGSGRTDLAEGPADQPAGQWAGGANADGEGGAVATTIDAPPTTALNTDPGGPDGPVGSVLDQPDRAPDTGTDSGGDRSSSASSSGVRNGSGGRSNSGGRNSTGPSSGSPNNGSANNGSANNGSANNGSANNGSAGVPSTGSKALDLVAGALSSIAKSTVRGTTSQGNGGTGGTAVEGSTGSITGGIIDGITGGIGRGWDRSDAGRSRDDRRHDWGGGWNGGWGGDHDHRGRR